MSKLIQFNCPDLLHKDLNNYVEARSKRGNLTRTDIIIEALTKYLTELGFLTPDLEFPLIQKKESA